MFVCLSVFKESSVPSDIISVQMESELIFIVTLISFFIWFLILRTNTRHVNDIYLNNYPYKSYHIYIYITHNQNTNNYQLILILHSLTQSLHYNSHNNHTIFIHTAECLLSENDFNFLLNSSTFFKFFKKFGKLKLCGSPSPSILGSIWEFYCRNCVRVRVMLEHLLLQPRLKQGTYRYWLHSYIGC